VTISQLVAALAVLAALAAVAWAVAAYRTRRATERALASLRSGTACGAYRPPATANNSGLCARCGMYDYKHPEAS